MTQLLETRKAPARPATAPRRSMPRALYPWLLAAAALGVWSLSAGTIIPSPLAVGRAFVEEFRSGRLLDDAVASLFRVSVGFVLATVLAVPLGVGLGRSLGARSAILPAINFLRSISPIAWIPFAILWFGIGDLPAIFIIFSASFLPLTLSTMSAVASIPSVYFAVARDYGIRGPALVTRVMIPAILPQLITALRVSAGIAWLVVVAAEMIAVRSGLGFLILDARNGLRIDLVVCGMIAIGMIGIGLDRLLALLTRLKSVRWGYES